jgi:sporulation protein YlmC with PRC-barrel domain
MSQQQHSDNIALEKLADTDLIISAPGDDIRGRRVVDSDGEEIGHVSSLFVDETERKVRMLELRVGGLLGLGQQHVLLPVEAITSVGENDVHVNQTRDRVVHSPAYDPALVVATTLPCSDSYYGYYGIVPYWGTDQGHGIGLR